MEKSWYGFALISPPYAASVGIQLGQGMRLGSEVPTRVGVSLSVLALGVSTYGHVYHSGARTLPKHVLVYHSGASIFSYVLIE